MKTISGKIVKAQKCVIYGPEGIGKSTFASQFPNPIFIDTEGSTSHLDVVRTATPTSWAIMLEYIKDIKKEKQFSTVVIDTIDWGERMCVKHICEKHNKTGIEEFGYGNGYVYVSEEFGRLLNLLQDVIDSGINVVLTAHSQIKKFELPNESGSFDRYELKLGKKTGSQTSPLVKEWADLMLFANYETIIYDVSEKTKKGKANGSKRVMYTTHHACWDAKNRISLPDKLDFEYGYIAKFIPADFCYEPSKKTEKKPDSQVKQEAQKPTPKQQDPVQEKPKPEIEVPKTLPIEKDPLQNLPVALADLMRKNKVTVDEIQTIVSAPDKGYYPRTTPIENYDPAFVQGVLVGAWDQVFASIKEIRDEEIPF